MCGLCAPGFGVSISSTECLACGNYGVAWLKTILLLMFVSGILVFSIARILNRKGGETSGGREILVSLKLVFTYLQVSDVHPRYPGCAP